MTKLITLAIAAAALTISASAATVTNTCSAFPIQFTGSTGSGFVSCPGFNVGGATLNAATLGLVADYTFGSGSSNDIKLTFTIGAPGGVTWALSSTAIDVLGGFSSSSTSPGIPITDAATAGVTLANFASAFNVGVASSIVAGGAGTSSAGVSITYDYTVATTVASPEPGSITLLGAGLIGLAFIGRKKLVN